MQTYFETFPDSYDPSSKRVINTPSALARNAFFYVQEVGYLKIRKSHLTKRQNLDSYLFVLCLSGEGSISYKGKTYKLAKGDCFWIDCMQAHSYQSSFDNPWELLWVHYNGSTSKQYYEHFAAQNDIVWHASFPEKYETLLREILTINAGKRIDAEIKSTQILTDLLCMILGTITEETEETEETNQVLNNIYSKLKLIRKYLDENYLDKITLDALSANFYISKYHMCREFKKVYGITIIEHIMFLRITYSKRILRFSDMSIDEIATICKMTDSSHFTKVFRASEGITPTKFRRKWRERI